MTNNINSLIKRIFNVNKANTTYSLIALLPLFLLTIPSVEAQMVSSTDVKTSVAKILQTNYTKMVNGDVEVKVSATPFAQLQLPDGKVSYKVVSGGDKIMPRDIKRVDVYVNNAFIKTLNLPVQTSVYQNVLVASDMIDREQTLTRECTTTKKVDVSMKMDYVLPEKMLEKEITTKKAFQKGEIIDKRFVKMRPDVQRNGEVRIFFVSNGDVMVTIDGTAMADGMTGDYINVENKNYKKVYNGKVIGENRVLVAI